jgi:hypothetical protein
MVSRMRLLRHRASPISGSLRKGIHFIVLVMSLSTAPIPATCASGGLAWTEEVKLHDGKVVRLERRAGFSTSGFPVQKRGQVTFHEFCYAPMRIYWKSRPEYRPELFDIVGGRAYAKVSLGDCTSCMLQGYPNSGALYFVWDAGGWRRIEYRDFPAQVRLNLLLTPVQANPRDDAHGLVTLADKEELDMSIRYELKARRAQGLNELPQRKGMCHACRSVSISTDRTSDVFLPPDRKACE